jgi:soluble lytic murein transglycosylase-like protein
MANVPAIGSDINIDQGSSVNPGSFDKIFSGSPLQGKFDAVSAAASKYGVSPLLVASVMAQETGRGKNVSKNNPGGIMDAANKFRTKKKFDSIDEGIDATAKVIAKNYEQGGKTVEGMGKLYSPPGAANDPKGLNNDWVSGVQKFMGLFSQEPKPVTAAFFDNPQSQAEFNY